MLKGRKMILAVGVLALFLFSGAAFAVTHITMGTAGVGGMNYPVGMAMAKIWNANIKDMKAVAIATAGAVQNIDMIRTKDIEVAVCRANEAYRAFNGIEKYPARIHCAMLVWNALSQALAKKRGRK